MSNLSITIISDLLYELRKWKNIKPSTIIVIIGMVLTYLVIRLVIVECCKLGKPLVEKAVELVSLILKHHMHIYELMFLTLVILALKAT